MRFSISDGYSSNRAYVDLFEAMGYVRDDRDPDFLVFTGGADVNPCLYGEPNTSSYTNDNRDRLDLDTFAYAQKERLPCVGICRGSQFLNVVCGGRMIQDIPNHGIGYIRTHSITTYGGGKFEVNSTHHQGIVLGPDGVELATSAIQPMVTEAFWYPSKGVFGVQWHPEEMDIESRGCWLFRDFFTLFLDRRLPINHIDEGEKNYEIA